jgi:hypothetical protein
MPLIYLQHPVHGTKVANMEMEAEFDEQNGWERYTPFSSPDLSAAPPSADSEVVTVVTAMPVTPTNNLQVKRRRSRTVEAAA